MLFFNFVQTTGLCNHRKNVIFMRLICILISITLSTLVPFSPTDIFIGPTDLRTQGTRLGKSCHGATTLLFRSLIEYNF